MSNYFEKYQKRKLISANISVVVSIAVVLFLLGILGFFMLNSKKITNHFKEKVIITVFFNKDAKTAEIKKFEKTIKLKKEIKSTKFIAKKEAAKALKEDIGEDFVEFLGYNPLQDNLEVTLKGDFVNEEKIESLKKQWLKKSFIAEVNYEYYKPIIKVLNQNVKKMSFWIILISSIIVLLVFLLINSAIRLSVYSKRFGIRTMQLVGATKAFIRKPYLLKAILFGAIGAGIASLAILGLLYYLNTIFPNVHFLQDTKLLLMLFSGIFITGLLITLISTYFATRKFFNLTSEELHY